MGKKNLVSISEVREKNVSKAQEVVEFENDYSSIRKKLLDEIDEYDSPALREIAKFVMDFERIDPISQLCKLCNRDEPTIRTKMETEFREHGRDFKALLVRIAQDLNKFRVPIIKQMLYDKAVTEKNLHAMVEFLKAEGAYGKNNNDKDTRRVLVPKPPPKHST